MILEAKSIVVDIHPKGALLTFFLCYSPRITKPLIIYKAICNSSTIFSSPLVTSSEKWCLSLLLGSSFSPLLWIHIKQ